MIETSLVVKLLVGFLLMALCVTVHAIGMTYALSWVKRHRSAGGWPFWMSVRMLVLLACWIIILHLVNIAFWAFLYTWKDAMPDIQSAFYFSAVTYTTTGYGDFVLPPPWRLVGGIEALTGLLMCGWSTGFFFAIVTRMFVALQDPGNSSKHQPSQLKHGQPHEPNSP